MSKSILLVYDNNNNCGDSYTYRMIGAVWNEENLIISSSNTFVATAILGGCSGSDGNVYIVATGIGSCIVSISVRDQLTNQLYTESVNVKVIPLSNMPTSVELQSNSVILFLNGTGFSYCSDYIPVKFNKSLPSNYSLVFTVGHGSYSRIYTSHDISVSSDENKIIIENYASEPEICTVTFKYGISKNGTWDDTVASPLLDLGTFTVTTKA